MKFSEFFKTKWRVVTDEGFGYEIQKKFWWLPVWFQVDINTGHAFGLNSFHTADGALNRIKKFTTPVPKFKSKVVAIYEP